MRRNSKKWRVLLFFAALLLCKRAFATGLGINPNIPYVSDASNPADIIRGIYLYSLGIAVVLAFGMIIYAALRYTVAAGDPGAQKDARDMITQALIGLLLLLGASLILSVINPDLLHLQFPQLQNVQIAAVQTPNTGVSNDEATQALQQDGIQIHSTGNCSDPSNPNCTSLEGLPQRAVTRLLDMQNGCRTADPTCQVIVTGGTETGHLSHGPGRSIVDLDGGAGSGPLNNYIDHQIVPNPGFIGFSPQPNVWYPGQDGNWYYHEIQDGRVHWHVCMNHADCPQAQTGFPNE